MFDAQSLKTPQINQSQRFTIELGYMCPQGLSGLQAVIDTHQVVGSTKKRLIIKK